MPCHYDNRTGKVNTLRYAYQKDYVPLSTARTGFRTTDFTLTIPPVPILTAYIHYYQLNFLEYFALQCFDINSLAQRAVQQIQEVLTTHRC